MQFEFEFEALRSEFIVTSFIPISFQFSKKKTDYTLNKTHGFSEDTKKKKNVPVCSMYGKV